MFYIVTCVWGYIEAYHYQSMGARTMGAIVVHGLWFSIVYISFWEWRWRLHYKESMISIKKGMGDDIISNLFLLAAKIFLSVISLFMIFVIYMVCMNHS